MKQNYNLLIINILSHTYIYTHIYSYTYIHTHTQHVYVCMYIYIYLEKQYFELYWLLLRVTRILGLTAKNLKTFVTTFRRERERKSEIAREISMTSPRNKTEYFILKVSVERNKNNCIIA